MSKLTYTPGPWYVDKKTERLRIRAVGVMSHDLSIAVLPVGQSAHPNAEADARLMASSPDLLDALKTLSAMYNDMGAKSYDLSEIRSILSYAIKKATGV